MSRRNVWLILGLLAVVGVLSVALLVHHSGRGNGSGAEGEDGPATARVERRDIQFSIEITGDVTPVLQVEIKPEVSARIIRLPFIAGQKVKRGDVLVELDDRDLKTQRETTLNDIEGARLAVERSKANFGRGEGLFEARLSSKQAFDNLSNDLAVSENALAKAEHALQLIDYQLTKTRILAPNDGTILAMPVVEGQVVATTASVNSGTSLMTIANLADLMVVANVNQVDVAKLNLNQQISVSMDALREPPMSAVIRFISPLAAVKNNIKGFEVDAKIDNPSERLRPGMTVNLTIPVDSVSNAISVPISAVFNEPDATKVVYVKRGGAVEKRPVKVGVTNYFYTQILEGVQIGEEVLLTPPSTGPRRG